MTDVERLLSLSSFFEKGRVSRDTVTFLSPASRLTGFFSDCLLAGLSKRERARTQHALSHSDAATALLPDTDDVQ